MSDGEYNPPHIYENDLGAYSDPQIGVGVANIIDIYVAPASVPFYAQLTGCGYAIWTMFILIGVTVIRKNRQALFIFFPVFCIWLSLLVSTPVFADFRYIYPVFTTLPLLLIAAFYPSKDQPEDTLSMT